MPGFDRHPGHAEHGNSGKENAALHRLPAPMLVVPKIESQLDPTVGAFNAGAAVKESHVQGAASAQHTVGVGGQVSFSIGSTAVVLGNGRQSTQALQDELEDVESVITGISDEIVATMGQLGMFGTGLLEQGQGQRTILSISGSEDHSQRQFSLEIHHP